MLLMVVTWQQFCLEKLRFCPVGEVYSSSSQENSHNCWDRPEEQKKNQEKTYGARKFDNFTLTPSQLLYYYINSKN